MVRWVDEDSLDLQRWYETPAEAASVRRASEYADAVISRLQDESDGVYGVPLPWSKARGRWALRGSELTIWAGINGSGKSLVTGHVALHLAAMGHRVCIASLEMRPENTMYRMTRQALGGGSPLAERVREFHELTDGLVWLFDHQGTIDWQSIVGLGRYLAQELEIEHFFIDSLMKLRVATDDYNTQKRVVEELCALAHDTGLHIHLVHHARKGRHEHEPIDKFAIKGAGEIVDQAHNGVLVWRNKAKEEDPDARRDEPDHLLTVCKQRDGEWEGSIKLNYHQQSMQLVETEKATDYLGRLRRLWGRAAGE